jgi:hypothetical protein
MKLTYPEINFLMKLGFLVLIILGLIIIPKLRKKLKIANPFRNGK